MGVIMGELISHARAHEMFAYLDGGLIRMERTSARALVGDEAGCLKSDGYCQISVDGRLYKRHRLIFFMFNGYWPKNDIDHINRDRSDDRIENLREATRSQNHRNSERYENAKGYCFHKRRRKWHAQIRVNGKSIHLGYHDTEPEAEAAFIAARIQYHARCN